MKMHAYPDSKCVWGYMTVCEGCKAKAPAHVDTTNPIHNPPTVNVVQQCEVCGVEHKLLNPEIPHAASNKG